MASTEKKAPRLKTRHRYRYMRERGDGSGNETTDQKIFEKWIAEMEPGDLFYVARCDWVQCERDGVVRHGSTQIPHVKKVRVVDAEEN